MSARDFTYAPIPANWQPCADDAERVDVSCPFCSGTHRHWISPLTTRTTAWRVPACEGGQASPRAYVIVGARTQARMPTVKYVSPRGRKPTAGF